MNRTMRLLEHAQLHLKSVERSLLADYPNREDLCDRIEEIADSVRDILGELDAAEHRDGEAVKAETNDG